MIWFLSIVKGRVPQGMIASLLPPLTPVLTPVSSHTIPFMYFSVPSLHINLSSLLPLGPSVSLLVHFT